MAFQAFWLLLYAVTLALAQNYSCNPNSSNTTSCYATFTTPNNFVTGGTENVNNNPVFAVGDSMNIVWKTNLPAVDLRLFQSDCNNTEGLGTGEYIAPLASRWTEQSASWDPITVNGSNGLPTINLKQCNIFGFAIYAAGAPDGNDYYTTSVYFNLTDNQVLPNGTVVSPSTSTSSKPSSSSSDSSSSPHKSHSASASPPPSSSGGLSTGAKAGIGIGAGLGVLALAALIAGFVLYSRRRRPAPTTNPMGYEKEVVTPMASPAPYSGPAKYTMVQQDASDVTPAPTMYPSSPTSGHSFGQRPQSDFGFYGQQQDMYRPQAQELEGHH